MRMTPTPSSDWLSMCSMSLTEVGQHALVDEDDARFDLVGGHAGVLPDDADDRDVDLREDVRGHAVDADRAEDGDQQRHHDERVGARQGQSYDPHEVKPSCDIRGRNGSHSSK